MYGDWQVSSPATHGLAVRSSAPAVNRKLVTTIPLALGDYQS
jgi:hypothetical protein